MKKIIEREGFEVNSSSTVTFTVDLDTPKNLKNRYEHPEDGHYVIKRDDWEYSEDIGGFSELSSLAFTWVLYKHDCGQIDDNAKEIHLKLIRYAIHYITGYPVLFDFDNIGDGVDIIDMDDLQEHYDKVFSSADTVIAFIFGDTYGVNEYNG